MIKNKIIAVYNLNHVGSSIIAISHLAYKNNIPQSSVSLPKAFMAIYTFLIISQGSSRNFVECFPKVVSKDAKELS